MNETLGYIKKAKIYLIVFIPLVYLTLNSWFYQFYIVQGNSMIPTLKHGDILLVSKIGFHAKLLPVYMNREWTRRFRNLHNFELIVFSTPDGKNAIKRIIGIQGDYYKFVGKEIYINDTLLVENYINYKDDYENSLTEFATDGFIPIEKEGRIPPGFVLLLGDNRANSSDSRFFGLVSEDNLIGKVIQKF